MKAVVLLLTFFLFVVSVRAQGTVVFNNTASPNYRFTTNTWSGNASNLLCCANYRIGLYGSTDLAAAESSLNLLLVATNAASPAAAGYFNGGSAVPIAGIPSGTSIRFQIRAWSLFAGMSYEEARVAQVLDPTNVGLSISALGTTTLGGGTILPGALFGTSPGLLTQGLRIIVPVPEPSAGALIFLGGLAFVMAGRRKRARV